MVDEMIKLSVGLALVVAGYFSKVAILSVSKKLNKKKEDVELAVTEQDYYRTLIKDLKEEREEFISKIDELNRKVDIMIKNDKEKNILLKLYENDAAKKDIIIKEKDKVIYGLQTELDKSTQ